VSELADHVENYLKLRRDLGFRLRLEGRVLPQFVAYLQAAGASTVTTDLAIAWAQLPTGVDPINWSHRLGAVRGFARYLNTIDPRTEIPPAGIFPRPPQRPTPYLYSPAEIDRLVEAAGGLRPSLRAATYRTLFGLLAVTGMRVGEALKLHRGEVDLDRGVLTITGPKSGHTRLLPLHPTSVDALRRYAEQRERRLPTLEAGTFFVSTAGTPLLHGNVRATFIKLTTAIGLRTANVRPRIHDLRHSLAVRCLLEWYRSGADVAAHMPTLSTYLGHVNPAGTYWYLSATPELMHLAARRLDRHRGGRP
jgi:integrase